jgi:parallel beta-helix repeat protein
VLRGQGAGSKIEYDFDGTTPLDGAGIAIFALDATRITVENLHVKGSTSVKGFNRGIYFDGGSYIRIQNNEIEGGIIGALFGFPSAIVLTRGTTDAWILNNNTHDNGRDDRSSYGVLLNSADGEGAHRVLIEGNRVVSEIGDTNKPHIGISVFDSTYVTIANNYVEGTVQDSLNSPGGYGVSVYGFEDGRSHHHVIKGNTVYNVEGTGVYVQNSPYTTVQGNNIDTSCTAMDAGSLAVGGIGVNKGPVTVTGNVIKDTGIGNISVNRPNGITVQSVDTGGCTVSGNAIEGGINIGIELRAPVAKGTISNNSIINTRGGISTLNTSGVNYYGLTITGNSIIREGVVSDNAVGIYLNGVVDSIIANNYISRAGGQGVMLHTDTARCILDSNSVLDSGQSGAGFDGLFVTGVGQHIVTGNISSSTETPKTNRYGIIENSDSNTVIDNHFGGATAASSLLGTNIVTDNNRDVSAL